MNRRLIAAPAALAGYVLASCESAGDAQRTAQAIRAASCEVVAATAAEWSPKVVFLSDSQTDAPAIGARMTDVVPLHEALARGGMYYDGLHDSLNVSRATIDSYVEANESRQLACTDSALRARNVRPRGAAPAGFRPIRDGDSITMSVSGVGMNRQRTEAIIAYGFSCGDLCGGWNLLVFRKDKRGRWQRDTVLVLGAS